MDALDTNAVMRQVATDLAGQFGADLVDVTDKVIAGQAPPPKPATRGLDVVTALEVGMSSLGIAHYLFALVPEVMRVRREHLTPEMQHAVVEAVARKFRPLLSGQIITTVNEAVKKRITEGAP